MKILSIAGSDPSAGAGIQNDLKTITDLGAYGLTVVTAVTSQNTKKFGKVEPLSSKIIKNQIDSVFADFKIDAIKIGMVYNSSIIKAIHSKLKKMNIPIVVDPVIRATTGGVLLSKKAVSDFKKFIVPLAYVITPNVREAETLSRTRIKQKKDLQVAAQKIRDMGAKNVIITGTKLEKNKVSDFVLSDKIYTISAKKIPGDMHGSGCTFSASLSVCIAKGHSMSRAVKFAKKYSYNSLKNAQKIGRGFPVPKIISKQKGPKATLNNAISSFTALANAHLLIPECQTNFVLSKQKPHSTKDILGISGRIVKAGKKALVAGTLEWGGSRHVATSVFTMNKKFPEIKSAINVRYDLKLIQKLRKKGFAISSYDRTKEPHKIKNKENSTVSWGIKTAIKNFKTPPDVIYHKGDIGKEAMILIFGKEPDEVVSKVTSIL